MAINTEIAGQVLPIVAKPPLAPLADAVQRGNALLQLTPGQHLKAEILASLPNNTYLARVAGETLQLEIPLNMRPGETLEMTFVSAAPKMTFQIAHPEAGAESVQLSSMGKWLASVAKNSPPLPAASQPLLENPAQGAGLLASKLQEALTQGGLFYESHLAQWVAGTLQLGAVLKEPQGKLSRASMGDDILDGGKAAVEIADPSLLPLVKEQLLLLNSGVMLWKGLAWPGQELELSIGEEEQDEGEPEVEANLKLILKHLGGIRAKLRFSADGLAVEFVCQRLGSAAVLKDGADELREALSSTGVHLSRMVAKDDQREQ